MEKLQPNANGNANSNSNWLANTISHACTEDSPEWSALLSEMTACCDEIIKDKYGAGKRFAQLSHAEQAAIIESQFFEMQQIKSSALSQFSVHLNNSIDVSLLESLEHIRVGSSKKATIGSSVNSLGNITAQAVEEILDTSPPEFKASAKLFLNRSIPSPLRSIIWKHALFSNVDAIKTHSNFLTPCLHVALSRRCQALLDHYFPTFFKRTHLTISFVKSTVAGVISHLALTSALNNADSVSKDVDTLVCVLIPLIYTFASTLDEADTAAAAAGKEVAGAGPETVDISPRIAGGIGIGIGRRTQIQLSPVASKTPETIDASHKSSGPTTQESYEVSQLVCAALIEMITNRDMLGLLGTAAPPNQLHVGAMKPRRASVSTGILGNQTKLNASPLTALAWKLLEDKDSTLARKLRDYRRIVPLPTGHVEDSTAHSSSSSSSSGSGFASKYVSRVAQAGASHDITAELENKYITTFESVMQLFLERGGVTFLDVECVSFLWDQGFIAGFHSFLPLALVALLLGMKSELIELAEVATAADNFRQFCRRITVVSIQRFLSEFCENELTELFDVGGNYKLQRVVVAGDNDSTERNNLLLQAVYCKWQKES